MKYLIALLVLMVSCLCPYAACAESPWETLGVSPGCSLEEARAAARRLSLRYHPDRVGGDAMYQRRINEALDSIRRGSYASNGAESLRLAGPVDNLPNTARTLRRGTRLLKFSPIAWSLDAAINTIDLNQGEINPAETGFPGVDLILNTADKYTKFLTHPGSFTITSDGLDYNRSVYERALNANYAKLVNAERQALYNQSVLCLELAESQTEAVIPPLGDFPGIWRSAMPGAVDDIVKDGFRPWMRFSSTHNLVHRARNAYMANIELELITSSDHTLAFDTDERVPAGPFQGMPILKQLNRAGTREHWDPALNPQWKLSDGNINGWMRFWNVFPILGHSFMEKRSPLNGRLYYKLIP